jgi:hypothetical protein
MPPEALDRSFPINMQRRSSEEHPRRRFDERDRIFSIVREEIKKWRRRACYRKIRRCRRRFVIAQPTFAARCSLSRIVWDTVIRHVRF